VKKSVSEQVTEAFLTDIFSNQFRPGEILSERMLTEAYGCSKTTMREVLATLCHSRILRSIPRMGYEVIWVETDQAREVLELRRIIELGIFRRSFQKATPETLDRLRCCIHRTREAEQRRDLTGRWDGNAEFHMELMRLSGNGYAEWSLQFALDTLKRALVQNLSNQHDSLIGLDTMVHHTAIVEAMERGDLEAAYQALEKDLRFFEAE